ncbi:hypothetical protein DQ392_22105 [Streptomyces reniochalinae]|uniref:Uncharacterized protein n=2 Tax=Streptomyces reniochalinae TaxID=2250578 RepID=A0A367EEA3_9ACTN|nr:hypothetical protein [Streptomyces reniochalinae]RCG16062.1 hypothetical protein DQ392_22105 [Streptomyces reniochalinae]
MRRGSAELSAWTEGRTPAEPTRVREAVEARDALAEALTQAGIQLPAMDVRTPWRDAVSGPDSPGSPGPAAHDDGHAPLDADSRTAARYALIHLGVCSAPVAFALAAVIARGAGR